MKNRWLHLATAGGALLLMTAAVGGQGGSSSEDQYAVRLAKLEGKKDPKAWLDLSTFCEDHLLWKEREEALRKAVEIDPKNAEAHERLDEVKAGKDWLTAEEAESKEAEAMHAKGLVLYGKGWIPSKEADKLREADRKSVGWPLEFRLDTSHLRIYSAAPVPFTQHFAALLENEIRTYQKFYGKTFKIDPKPIPLRVYFFSDRDTYERILTRDAPGSFGAGNFGIYAGTTQILYMGLLDERESDAILLKVAAHEMTHALDDILAHCASTANSIVFVEGRAGHLGNPFHGRHSPPGGICLPAPPPPPRGLGEAIDGVDLHAFMRLDQKAFMGEGVLQHYALSWAWVHFLFHAQGGRYASGFRTYLQGIPGKAGVAHFEKAVGTLSDLEPEFKHYVKEELIPGAESFRQFELAGSGAK